MNRYIEQLIDEIHQATWNLKPPHQIWKEAEADPDNELELEDLSHVEKYIYGEKEPVSQITGIDPAHLPPEEKLTQKQQALLATELEKLLQYFHFQLDFPANYPARLRYPFIRRFWNEEHVSLSFGENHIEFCDYEGENCPFPGYCTICEEVNAQMKDDGEPDSKADFDFEGPLLPDLKQIDDIMKSLDNDDETSENTSPF